MEIERKPSLLHLLNLTKSTFQTSSKTLNMGTTILILSRISENLVKKANNGHFTN